MDDAADQKLLRVFTSTFAKIDLTSQLHAALVGTGLVHDPWYVKPYETDPLALEELYSHLPARFPPLYEKLLLNYRWTEIDLKLCRLLPNPIGTSLTPFRDQLMDDRTMIDVLLAAKLIPFGKAAGGCYDPVCFDMSHTDSAEAAPVVQLDHEGILCEHRIVQLDQLATSFRAFVDKVIASVVSEAR